jgi:hypothetical protein
LWPSFSSDLGVYGAPYSDKLSVITLCVFVRRFETASAGIPLYEVTWLLLHYNRNHNNHPSAEDWHQNHTWNAVTYRSFHYQGMIVNRVIMYSKITQGSNFMISLNIRSFVASPGFFHQFPSIIFNDEDNKGVWLRSIMHSLLIPHGRNAAAVRCRLHH